MASGDAFSRGRAHTSGDGVDADDAAVRTSAEVEEAKRRRGRVRRREDGGAGDEFEKDDADRRGGKGGAWGLSLITDESADPDAYESNAAGNAECPVEPFNMNAEQEGGLGYFDGDTYVFRQNKPVDGEEDAWLDGFGDGEGEEGKGGGGGLDSSTVYKPPEATKDGKQKKKAKFVNEDAIPEDLGRRLATLLEKENDTVMAALTRNGASMRGLQSQEQKLMKKSKLRKRKPSKNNREDDDPALDSEGELKRLKLKMEQTRETVEELTELADALLFGGETDSYELTKSDWIRRFKLERYFPSSQKKRPPASEAVDALPEAKRSRGYFDDPGSDAANDGDGRKSGATPPERAEVTWEYKGNEDGAIHGPYTSRQMLEWTSCGYFVGEGAVDIRRVRDIPSAGKEVEQKDDGDAKVDVDDLMADLMDDDDDEAGSKKDSEESKVATSEESSWM
ncbi:hypothetical protein ACHAWF_003395, partial [Thalassiosira exigua]